MSQLITVDSVGLLREQIHGWRSEGLRIGFVPTMGNLHAGHIALVRRALELADRVVVSVFVNPMQFGPNEDYETYPRTLNEDSEKLSKAGVHLLFAPPVNEVYGNDLQATTRVEVPGISDELCGRSRPGFFVGVTTVVAKLFNLVQPDLAVFGEKDYQQLIIIRRMVAELAMPIEIVGAPIVREADGLAMSSRNAYLNDKERAVAPRLYEVLREVAAALASGERDFARLSQQGRDELQAAGFRPDYVEIRHGRTLAPARPEDQDLVVLAAAWLGDKTRLIDNIHVIN